MNLGVFVYHHYSDGLLLVLRFYATNTDNEGINGLPYLTPPFFPKINLMPLYFPLLLLRIRNQNIGNKRIIVRFALFVLLTIITELLFQVSYDTHHLVAD